MSLSPVSDLVASIKSSLGASKLSPIIRCDISGENDSCGAKLDAIIVSATFEGMPLLQRQKLVHEAVSIMHSTFIFLNVLTLLQLKSELQRVHAFSMKTWTVAEAEARLAKCDAHRSN
jgi:stress-induced morphogen